MSLNENALTTLSNVKNELDITSNSNDSYLNRQINAYSDLFEEATDRKWYKKTGHTEKVKSYGNPRLIVKDFVPVQSVSSITIDEDTVDSTSYEIEDAEKGYIRMKEGAFQSTGVTLHKMKRYDYSYEYTAEVTYTGGPVTPVQESNGTFSPRTLSYAIEEAVITTVATKYLQKGKPGNVTSGSAGDLSISYGFLGMDESILGRNVTELFHSQVMRHKNRSVI
jgi:hypothetical protein